MRMVSWETENNEFFVNYEYNIERKFFYTFEKIRNFKICTKKILLNYKEVFFGSL